jgi:hypothetical protein
MQTVVQKMPVAFNRRVTSQTRLDGGAIMLKETEAEATLENCRALINQITVGLSAEKPFVDFLSATEVLLYLDFACSALKKSALHSREQKITLHYLH